MKIFFFVFIIMLCVAVPDISAQRYLPGLRGLQFTSGTVNGLNPQNGLHAGIAFSQYTKSSNRWVFGAEYLEKRYPYKDLSIPQSQFTADAGYYLKFLSDSHKTFFVSVGASAMAGYETINWNDKTLPDGATLQNRDRFIYGGAITLEIETYLTDRVVLLFTGRERILFGSDVAKFHTQFGIGLKFMIN